MSAENNASSELPANLWRRLFGDWSVLHEKPIPVDDLSRSLEVSALPSGGFYLMLALSTAIATLGLILNSAAVIIGAMIIAPLMNPIISLSYASVRGENILIMRSLLTLVTGIFLVLIVSYATTCLVGSRVIGNEIISRGNPSLLDLGVAIGAGIAGAYALTRSKIGNALPGVAVAVALVPPLCVTGIGLAFGAHGVIDPASGLSQPHSSLSLGAFLLFLTNLAAILFFGGFVFVWQGYGHWRAAARQIVLVVITLIVLVFPLTTAFRALYFRSEILSAINEVGVKNDDWRDVQVLQMDMDIHSDPVNVRLSIYAREGVFEDEDFLYLEKGIEERIGRPIELEVYVSEYTKLESKQL
jgi:uncharacterized hydrophobic protein (TIGR00271 family)